jgi:ABC-type transport system involved in multi-copper enzyme maturation permease subunit
MGYLTILCLYLLFAFGIEIANRSTYRLYLYNNRIGRDLFVGFASIQLALVIIISPALTWGSISGEKEKKTFEMLMMTLLSKHQIIFGKFLSSILYILEMILLSIPLAFVMFMLGGISIPEVLLAYSVILVSIIFCGFIGFFCSNLFQKTYFSTITSVVVILAFVLGTVIATALLDAINFWNDELAIGLLLPFSPIAAMISVFNPGEFTSEISAIWGVGFPMWLLNIVFSFLIVLMLWIFLQKKFRKLHTQ